MPDSEMADYTLHKVNGLACYRRGKGPEVFIMPYPHASSYRPVAESRLADLVTSAGYSILSFDPPGFMNSSRPPALNLNEMMECTLECLRHFKVENPIPFIAHSMGSFCALAFTIQHPGKTERLLAVGGTTGWEAVRKYGLHHSFSIFSRNFWYSRYLGLRMITGTGNLSIHKKSDNLNSSFSFMNPEYYEEIPVNKKDRKKPPPKRYGWMKIVRNYNLQDHLSRIKIPVLLITGRGDRITPLKIAEELYSGISDSRLLIFEKSGHSPFIEESEKFRKAMIEFFNENSQA